MKIAVLGAPGTGKTRFARALAKQLRQGVTAAHEDPRITIIDNYAQRIQKASGLALGPWASYSENYMVAGTRMAEERIKRSEADHSITVGTIMDTIVYSMVKSDIVFHHESEEERNVVFAHAQGAVQGLSVWYTETWDYDLGFFLPLAKGSEHVWQDSINDAYAPVIESFFVSNVYSLEGEAKERVEIAYKVIEVLAREQSADTKVDTAPLDEQSVRARWGTSEDGGDPAESVPDVPSD